MNPMHDLFSFNGRMRRMHFWLYAIAIGIVHTIIQFVVGLVTGGAAATAVESGSAEAAAGAGGIGAIVSLIISLFFFWPAMAVSIKRAHDRNQGAMVVLTYYILFAIFLVAGAVLVGGAIAAAGPGGQVDPNNISGGAMGAMAGGGIVMMIMGLVLVIYAIYLLINLGFLDGTPGPNRFGPSPKYGDAGPGGGYGGQGGGYGGQGGGYGGQGGGGTTVVS